MKDIVIYNKLTQTYEYGHICRKIPHLVPIWEVKSIRAWLVLRWETTREYHVLYSFFFFWFVFVYILYIFTYINYHIKLVKMICVSLLCLFCFFIWVQDQDCKGTFKSVCPAYTVASVTSCSHTNMHAYIIYMVYKYMNIHIYIHIRMHT